MNGGAIFTTLLLTLPILVSLQPASAAVSDCDNCLYSSGVPVFTPLGAFQAFKTAWVNYNSKASDTFIVMMVIHDRLGQTVEISTSVIQLGVGAEGTAYPVVFGLSPGEYSAAIFVVTTSGVAVTTTTAISFSV
jgi:hypothetical protein